MKIGVAAMEMSMEGKVSSRFGRCPCFLIVESENDSFEGIKNPAADLPGGAGPAAVQALADHNVQVAVAGEFGPKAIQALQVAGIRPVESSESIRDAVAKLRA